MQRHWPRVVDCRLPAESEEELQIEDQAVLSSYVYLSITIPSLSRRRDPSGR